MQSLQSLGFQHLYRVHAFFRHALPAFIIRFNAITASLMGTNLVDGALCCLTFFISHSLIIRIHQSLKLSFGPAQRSSRSHQNIPSGLLNCWNASNFSYVVDLFRSLFSIQHLVPLIRGICDNKIGSNVPILRTYGDSKALNEQCYYCAPIPYEPELTKGNACSCCCSQLTTGIIYIDRIAYWVLITVNTR